MRYQKLALVWVTLLLSSCGFQLQTAATATLPFRRLKLISDQTSLLFDTQLTKQLRAYNTIIDTHSTSGAYILKLSNYRIIYDQPTFSTSNEVLPLTFQVAVRYQLLRPNKQPVAPTKTLTLTKYQIAQGDQLYLSLPKYINSQTINRELASRLIKQLQYLTITHQLPHKA